MPKTKWIPVDGGDGSNQHLAPASVPLCADSTSQQSDSDIEHFPPRVLSFVSSPSTEEFGCYFTPSSNGSTYASDTAAGVEDPKKEKESGERGRRRFESKRIHRLTSKKMSQDAEDGPEVLFVDTTFRDAHAHLYNANRPPMNQEEFDSRFHYRLPPRKKGGELCRRGSKFMRHYYRPCLSGDQMARFIFRLVPILHWLPHYQWRQTLLSDALGGLTVAVMHVPQGIAYAMLAGVDAVVGLYTSFFPALFYMLFGTSRHNSIGSFAVVALMTRLAVDRLSLPTDSSLLIWQVGNSSASPSAADTGQHLYPPVVVSTTLAFAVGLVQILMGVFRLELVTTYFSDQLVAGFTTGASIHVFTAQLKDLFGLPSLPRRSGAGYLFVKLYDILAHLPQANPVTLAFSAFSIAFLCLGKELLTPWLQRRFDLRLPIPFELLLVCLSTGTAQLFHLHSRHGIRIVDHIPAGLPSPVLPQWELVPQLLPDAMGIAAVVIAVHISLAKMFAKKMDYKVDPGQELFALGFSSSLSAFFPVYPVSCSLGRTLVNVEAGTKTQLSTVFSSALLAAIILYLGQWLRTLPMCVLSAIIIVALKGMFKKLADLRTLWPLSKIDFSIWLVSLLATVCWDVTEGLAVSIFFALMTTVFRSQWPRWHFLANLTGTNDFRDAERYEMVCSFPGICIFRFDSPLLFTNVDNFKETIHKAFHRWDKQQRGLTAKRVKDGSGPQLGGRKWPDGRGFHSPASANTLSPSELVDNDIPHRDSSGILASERTSSDEENSNGGLALRIRPCTASPPPPPVIVVESGDGGPKHKGPPGKEREVHFAGATWPPNSSGRKESVTVYYRHFIIDCSGFTFVDCMGVNALKEIFTEMRRQRVLVYFAAAKAPVRDLFQKCGFYKFVQKHNFYPTIRDAVAIARKRRNAYSQYLLDEPTEQRYDAMDVMHAIQPED